MAVLVLFVDCLFDELWILHKGFLVASLHHVQFALERLLKLETAALS
jgi:hypothetical protein